MQKCISLHYQNEAYWYKLNTTTDFGIQNSNKDFKFKGDDHVIISEYRNIFAKSSAPNWNEDVFMIKSVKNTILWACVI